MPRLRIPHAPLRACRREPPSRPGSYDSCATRESQGFGIPLPKKVGDSSTFYPDFLIWKKGVCWAVDTTGRHLLDEKVRGKLVALETPRMALVVRGTVDLGSGSREGKEGWSLVLGRGNLRPIVEHSDDLDALVTMLFDG